jgi:hypothetical protein
VPSNHSPPLRLAAVDQQGEGLLWETVARSRREGGAPAEDPALTLTPTSSPLAGHLRMQLRLSAGPVWAGTSGTRAPLTP